MSVVKKFRSLIPPRLETQDHIRKTSDPSPTQQLDNGVFVITLKNSRMLLFFSHGFKCICRTCCSDYVLKYVTTAATQAFCSIVAKSWSLIKHFPTIVLI